MVLRKREGKLLLVSELCHTSSFGACFYSIALLNRMVIISKCYVLVRIMRNV
jgi:hypothetical protein